jgi:hypothetical protein
MQLNRYRIVAYKEERILYFISRLYSSQDKEKYVWWWTMCQLKAWKGVTSIFLGGIYIYIYICICMYVYCDVVSRSLIIRRPLLSNGHNKNAYFSGNRHISRRYLGNCLDNRDRIVEFPQQCYMLANAASKTKRTLGQVVLSLVREALLKKVDFDRAVSSQHKAWAGSPRDPSQVQSTWELRTQTD